MLSLKASKVRKQLGYSMFQPVNIFDACTTLGITVRFVDINMEGLYVAIENLPNILISNQRPLPRRCFTCAHELGHHLFGHGFKLDILSEEQSKDGPKESNEILVDAFAAAFLMPVGGIQAAFVKRKIDMALAEPIDFFKVASQFGVGYTTLVTHCKASGLITDKKSMNLSKQTPHKIFQSEFGPICDKSHFKVIDKYSNLSLIDLEVGNYLIIPSESSVDSEAFEKVRDSKGFTIYMAAKAGISSLDGGTKMSNSFLRIQRQNYVGFAEFRHLED